MNSDYLQKCHIKYKTLIKYNNDNIDSYKIYEMLYALKYGYILWDDTMKIKLFHEKYGHLPNYNDYGVDVINMELDKTVQVKHYCKKSTIKWRDISTFYTYSSAILKINDMVLSTTKHCKINSMVNELIKDNIIKIDRNNLDDLMKKTDFSNIKKCGNILNKRKIIIEERYYLLECYELIKKSKKKNINLQLACSSGKSYIFLYIINKILNTNGGENEKFLIMCPWVELVKQTLNLFQNYGISSDFIGDGKHNVADGTNVIICTYSSIKYVPTQIYKYIIIDEAHHVEDSDLLISKELEKIKCEKRLNFSATFKNQDNLDYNYTMEKGIADGYITDYILHIEYFSQGNKLKSLANLIKNNIEWSPILIYFNSTKKCKKFNTMLKDIGVKSEYLIGTDSKEKRKRIRNEISNYELNVLSLCGVYNESVSIDEVQTIIYGDLRHSDINKIQIAMRGCRKCKGKPFFRIVLPLIEKDFIKKDVSTLVKTFTKIDSRIKKDIIEKTNKMIRIECNDKKNDDGEDNKEGEMYAKWLYNEIYDRFGKIISNPIDDNINEFMEWVDKNERLPIKSEKAFFKGSGQCMSGFILRCKSSFLFYKEPYNKLLKNSIIKKDFEKFLKKKEYEKTKIKITRLEKINAFINFINEKKEIPIEKGKYLFIDGCDMSGYWTHIKHKLKGNANPYNKLLEVLILKKDYDKFMEYKNNKPIKKIILTINDKIEQLLNYVNTYEKLPRVDNGIIFTDKTNLPRFWIKVRENRKADKKPYNILLKNKILKGDYENYIEKKENEIVKLTVDDKIAELLKYVEENNKLPIGKILFTNGKKMVNFWNDVKIDNKFKIDSYKILLNNKILKESYELCLKTRDIRKLKVDDKISELLHYVEENKHTPMKEVLLSNGQNMRIFWYYSKKGNRLNNEPYNKLLENEILKESYEKKL